MCKEYIISVTRKFIQKIFTFALRIVVAQFGKTYCEVSWNVRIKMDFEVNLSSAMIDAKNIKSWI